MQPDEPETIVGEWWILGAQWEGPELHTIVHIFDTNERPRWGSTSSNRLLRQELGYMQLDRRGAEMLFQVLTEREETASVAIASNESFSGWTKTFTDPRLCAAIVDRLTFAGNIIETGTESYRLAHARATRATT